jgi:branched-chain amino acid transport system substrate-binding protein
MRLALNEAEGKAGPHTISFEALDGNDDANKHWTSAAETANARKAARDKSAVAYLGPYRSDAAKVSIPILSKAGLPQISPSNTLVGLTVHESEALDGEPDIYYPGKRTYARVIPRNTVQGAALATLMAEDGCTNVALAKDSVPFGVGLAGVIEATAADQGMKLAVNETISPNAPSHAALAERARQAGADCFVYSGHFHPSVTQLFRDVGAALPQARLYGSDGLAGPTPFAAGLGPQLAQRVQLVRAPLGPDGFPARSKAFLARYEQTYGEPETYAIYGYEAMALALDAIARSRTGTREAVRRALFDTRERESVIGTYSIDANGDTTLTDYGVYVLRDGAVTFDRAVRAAMPSG